MLHEDFTLFRLCMSVIWHCRRQENLETEARRGEVTERASGGRQFEKQYCWQHWSWPTEVCTTCTLFTFKPFIWYIHFLSFSFFELWSNFNKLKTLNHGNKSNIVVRSSGNPSMPLNLSFIFPSSYSSKCSIFRDVVLTENCPLTSAKSVVRPM